jgi:TolB-like protein/tetratricopeptide (TPR) repeat protein
VADTARGPLAGGLHPDIFLNIPTSPATEKALRVPDPLSRLTTALAGRYHIEREVGHGGMATVYLARDLKHDRRVAIKVLRSELAHVLGPGRFLREIEIAARLQHPLILPVFDSGAEAPGDDGTAQCLWYAMPFIAGESLRGRLDRERQLSVDEAVRIAGEVAQALGCAHAQGVVHRDIKPENILLSDGHAIVADFGIARALDATVSTRLTETGLALGTPVYMSPEQAAGEAGIDGRSDIYALGCVLYEMLAGQPPFTGSTAQSIRARHAVDPVPSLRGVRSTVTRELEGVIRRALAKVPADRFASAEEFAAALGSGHASRAAGRRPSKLLLGGAATAATGLLLLAIIRSSGSGASTVAGAASIKSLAVLPFSNLTGDTAQVYLAQGLTDQLVTSLAQLSALRVVNLKGAKEVTVQLVKELGLDAVLAGSLQRAGNAVHITVQLNSATTNQALWAHDYDGELSSILDLQAQVAKSVASRIGTSMTPKERAQLTAERPAINPAAYEAYVRGSYFEQKVTTPDLRKGIGYFQQAIEADPAYAPAYAGLANCYNLLGYFSMESPEEVFPQAQAATLRALKLDSMLGEAHGALAASEFFYGWNFIAAEPEFRRALELDPKWAIGHNFYGLFLTAMNRTDEANAEMNRAQELDPLTLILHAAVARPYYNARRYPEAIAQSRKTLVLDSTYHRAHYWLGLSYEQLSRLADAIRELEYTVAQSPISLYRGALGHAYAIAGQRAKALQVLKELEARSDSSYVSPFDIATIFAGLGDRSKMFEYLEKAYQERVPYLVFLAVDPHFDAFHGDPRFRDLVHRIGLPAGS